MISTSPAAVEKRVREAFVAALLLSGSAAAAESAVLEAVESVDRENGATLVRLAIQAAIGPGGAERSAEDDAESARAVLALPPELRRVALLPAELRQPFLLRVLCGFSAEASSRLLRSEPSELDSRIRAAVFELSGSKYA